VPAKGLETGFHPLLHKLGLVDPGASLLIALKAGLVEVVKSTITGSIIGNLLLVMGLAMFLGAIRYREQEFQPIVARECFCDELRCDRHSLTYYDTLDCRPNSIGINPTFLDGDRFDLGRGLRSDTAVFNANSLLPL